MSRSSLARMRVDGCIPPLARESSALPLSPPEREIVRRFDGLHTVDEIADACGAARAAIEELVLELEWYGELDDAMLA